MAPRVTGKWLAPFIVVALIATVSTLIFFFFREQSIDAGPVARVAVPGGEVVVRPGHEQRGYFFLSRIDGDDEESWRTALFGFQEGTQPVLHEGKVFLRTMRSSGLYETHVFDISDGSFVWSGGTPGPPFHQTGAPGPTFIHGNVVIEVYEGAPGQVLGLRVADGKPIFNVSAPVPPGATLQNGTIRLLTDPPSCLNAASGEPVACE